MLHAKISSLFVDSLCPRLAAAFHALPSAARTWPSHGRRIPSTTPPAGHLGPAVRGTGQAATRCGVRWEGGATRLTPRSCGATFGAPLCWGEDWELPDAQLTGGGGGWLLPHTHWLALSFRPPYSVNSLTISFSLSVIK